MPLRRSTLLRISAIEYRRQVVLNRVVDRSVQRIRGFVIQRRRIIGGILPAAKYTMGFPLYGAGWAGGLTSANRGMYQNATGIMDPTGALTFNGTSPVPNANGVGNCSSGDNQSSPAAGCDYRLTDGLAT